MVGLPRVGLPRLPPAGPSPVLVVLSRYDGRKKPSYPTPGKRPLIRDRGPELVNRRITVFDLLPSLMDPSRTDAGILAWYPAIDATQLAAIRAYALEYAERLVSAREPSHDPPIAGAVQHV